MIDPTSDRPVYQQVADVLRLRIHDGEAVPGDRMPSETELMGEFGISRTTARLTYSVLRNEGLVESLRGRGAFVRRPRTVQRIAAERYLGMADRSSLKGAGRAGRDGNVGAGHVVEAGTPFTTDHGIDWRDYDLDRSFEEGPAPDEVAALLEVEAGTPVLARRFVFHAEGEPRQASTSYLPLDLVAGTPVADPAREPWPGGTVAQLASLGVTVTRVEESVRARMPAPEERRALRIAEGVPVLTVTRRMRAGGRVVEAAADIVLPADRFALDYAVDLPPPPPPPSAPATGREAGGPG